MHFLESIVEKLIGPSADRMGKIIQRTLFRDGSIDSDNRKEIEKRFFALKNFDWATHSQEVFDLCTAAASSQASRSIIDGLKHAPPSIVSRLLSGHVAIADMKESQELRALGDVGFLNFVSRQRVYLWFGLIAGILIGIIFILLSNRFDLARIDFAEAVLSILGCGVASGFFTAFVASPDGKFLISMTRHGRRFYEVEIIPVLLGYIKTRNL